MNVLQVLTITTVGFLAFVAIWITTLEDYIEARSTDRRGDTGDRFERGGE